MKKTAALTFFVLCLSLFGSSAFAYDCQNKDEDKDLQITQKLSKQLGYGDTYLAACKTLPNNKDETIFVLINTTKNKENSDENCFNVCSFDLNILRVTNNGNIKERYHKEAALSEDSMRFEKLIIDTGRYQLSKDIRAFGFRLSFYGLSRASPYNTEVLYLFYSQNDNMIPLFKTVRSSMNPSLFVGMIVGSYQGEWDTVCSGNFKETTSTIDINNNGNGINNFILKTETDYILNTPNGEDCQEGSFAQTTAITKFIFDVNTFLIPDNMSKE